MAEPVACKSNRLAKVRTSDRLDLHSTTTNTALRMPHSARLQAAPGKDRP